MDGHRWEDRHQEWFDSAVDRLRCDLRSTTGLDLDLRVDLSDPDGLEYRFSTPDGGFHGQSLPRPASEPDAVCSVADLFADDVVEELWRGWPPCPGHDHPAVAVAGGAPEDEVEAGGDATWDCPTTGRSVGTIGELRADLATVVDAYWQHYGLRSVRHRDDDARRWAWEVVDGVIDGLDDGVRIAVEPLDLLVALADAAPDEHALAYLGAGPVEDLLTSGRGARLVAGVERLARRNRRFRMALRSAYYDEHLDAADVERLRRFGAPP